jgi:hypothetical protein
VDGLYSRGTYQNSSLFGRQQAFARLMRTGDFVAVRTFGSTAEVDEIGRRVRKIHTRLRLTDEARAGFRMWANASVPLWLAPLKVVYPTLAALAFALLPGWARGLYGLPPWEFPLVDAPATAALRALRLAMLATLERLRGGTPVQRRYTNRALELMRADLPALAAA